MTKDGIVILSHDASTSRLTGIDLEISETNYADLPKYSHSKIALEFGSTTQQLNNEPYCTLEALF